jgi:23S rRNA (pseudouridine1915-N3)-methyltransferase
MFEITLIAMGKLKEKFYLSAAAEYEKRMKGYCQFKLVELPESRLPDNPSPAEITAGLEKEADLILSKIPKGAWFCTLTPEGKMLSSEDLAKKLQDMKGAGKSSACFLIGSSFGIAQRIKDKAIELLRSGAVDRSLGWKTGEFFYDLTPAVFETAEEAEKDFVYSGFSGANLSKYAIALSRKPNFFMEPPPTQTIARWPFSSFRTAREPLP